MCRRRRRRKRWPPHCRYPADVCGCTCVGLCTWGICVSSCALRRVLCTNAKPPQPRLASPAALKSCTRHWCMALLRHCYGSCCGCGWFIFLCCGGRALPLAPALPHRRLPPPVSRRPPPPPQAVCPSLWAAAGGPAGRYCCTADQVQRISSDVGRGLGWVAVGPGAGGRGPGAGGRGPGAGGRGEGR